MAKETITGATCITCGMCCVAPYDQDRFADVTEKDETRLGRRFVRLNIVRDRPIDTLAAMLDGVARPYGAIATKWIATKSGPFKEYEMNACTALKGSVGSAVRCTVYEKRPDVCRNAVEPGDRACREIRSGFLERLEGGW